MPIFVIGISFLALVISAITAWLTLFRRGALQMTRPTVIFFGPDGPSTQMAEWKVFIRTLPYSTAKRPQLLESMHIRLRRGESVQTFNIWAYGEKGHLLRGSGLNVPEEGVVYDHHFVLPKDGTTFHFLPGEYVVDVYASLVNSRDSHLLWQTKLGLTNEQSAAIAGGSGVYFDWGPDSKSYHSHIDRRSKS